MEEGVISHIVFLKRRRRKNPVNTGFFLYEILYKKRLLFRGALPFIKANCRNSEEQAAGEQKCSMTYNLNLLHFPLPNF